MTEPFGAISEPWWDDQPLWIVGGGPSLSGYDLSNLRSRGRVLGVNRAADIVPCDATFSLDRMFMTKRDRDIAQWARSGQEIFAAVPEDWFTETGVIPNVTYLLRKQGKGVGQNPRVIINGRNSGYGALCLGILKKATMIILLGFDFRTRRSGERRQHWHEGYPWTNGRSLIYYERWAALFDSIRDELPAGVAVWNANPASAVTAFPFRSYEDMGLRQMAVSEVAV